MDDQEFFQQWVEQCSGFEPSPFDSWYDLTRSICDRSTWSPDDLDLRVFEDPKALTIGFKCINTGEVWRIRLQGLGKDVLKNPFLREAMGTSDGRAKLAVDFTNGLFDPQLCGDLSDV